MNKPYFKSKNILIYNDDILKFHSVSKNSVDLIITSPPYNVDIHYNSHSDNLNYEDYLGFTRKWIKKCFEDKAIDSKGLDQPIFLILGNVADVFLAEENPGSFG